MTTPRKPGLTENIFNFLNRIFDGGADSTQKKAKRRQGRTLRIEELEIRDMLCATPFGDLPDAWTGCLGPACVIESEEAAETVAAPTGVEATKGTYVDVGGVDKWNCEVSWTEVVDPEVIGYQLLWDEGNEAKSPGAFVSIGNSDGDQYDVGLLEAGTYRFQVLAIYQDGGGNLTHSASDSVSLQVGPDKLEKPATPEVAANTVKQTDGAATWEMTISWADDADADNYAVYMNGSDTSLVLGANFSLVPPDPGDTTWTATIRGLTAGTNYTFQVQAIGSGAHSDSVKSEPVSQKTVAPAVAPAVSADLREDKGDITLGWGAETPGLTYTVQYSIDGGKTWLQLPSSGNAHACGSYTPAEADKVPGANMYVRGLVKEATYQFRVTVTNADGISAHKASNSVKVTAATVNTVAATTAVKPSSAKSPTKQNGLDSVTVSWNHNAANVGYEITVKVKTKTGWVDKPAAEVGAIAFVGNKASVTITGLDPNKKYRVTITATNALGNDVMRNGKDAVKTVTAKTLKYTVPTNLWVDNKMKNVDVGGNALTWNAPKTNGTEDYTIYVLQGKVKAKNFDQNNPAGAVLTFFRDVDETFIEWTDKDKDGKGMNSLAVGKYTIFVVAQQNGVFSSVARKMMMVPN